MDQLDGLNSHGINGVLNAKGKNCKRLLQPHVISYEETFSPEIKNIDSYFMKLVYSFHSAYQEREIGPSMKKEKRVDAIRINACFLKSPNRGLPL